MGGVASTRQVGVASTRRVTTGILPSSSLRKTLGNTKKMGPETEVDSLPVLTLRGIQTEENPKLETNLFLV